MIIMDKYIYLFENVSVAEVIVWILALATLFGAIYKILENYRKKKNEIEMKFAAIDEHTIALTKQDTQIAAIDEKMDKILESITALSSTSDERETRRLRREILKFSDNLRLGKDPSKDSFEDIFDCNEQYEILISKSGIKNGYTEQEMKFVKNVYAQLYQQTN